MALKICAAVTSDIGKVRANNEDNFFLDGSSMPKEDMDGGASRTAQAGTDCALFAVCDGMGGEERGEDASSLVVTHLARLRAQFAQGVADVRGSIDRTVAEANRLVCDLARDEAFSAGTTLVLLGFYDDEAFCANLGDSRLYVLRDGVLTQLTRDHTEAGNLVAAGVLTSEEAAASAYKNVLTRYLGADNGGAPVAPMHYRDFVLHYGDRFLLCSDGLTDMLPDEAIAQRMRVDAEPAVIARLLADAALAAGGRDNVTAMIVDVEEEAPRQNGAQGTAETAEAAAEIGGAPGAGTAAEAQPEQAETPADAAPESAGTDRAGTAKNAAAVGADDIPDAAAAAADSGQEMAGEDAAAAAGIPADAAETQPAAAVEKTAAAAQAAGLPEDAHLLERELEGAAVTEEIPLPGRAGEGLLEQAAARE